MDYPKRLFVLPIRNTVLFPETTAAFLVRRKGSIAALEKAQQSGDLLVVISQLKPDKADPRPEDLYRVGTLVRIEKVTGNSLKGYQVVAKGLARFQVESFYSEDGFLSADGEAIPDVTEQDGETIQVLFKNLKDLSKEIIDFLPGEAATLSKYVDQEEDPRTLSYLVIHHLEIPVDKKQSILEDLSLKNRLLLILELLQKNRDLLKLQSDLRDRMARNLGKSQREAILREQLKTIREELGEEGPAAADEYRTKIEKAGLSPDARKIAEQELKRLDAAGPSSPDAHVIRTYLDWLCALPWQKSSGVGIGEIDLDRARKILDEDHFGLEKIKRRILQHLAVIKLKGSGQGTILCFVGPPGVGKTSLGQSIARALGRKFVRASLGGMRDDAEIRGHRRTYIGALPGRIIQSIRRAEENDPVFMLDEIDKLSHGFYGDPASAMLEVLDPEQNSNFQDHYLDVPFDLSKVFFVATANTLDTIPAPLQDRMEIIELAGYTQAEKLAIAKRHLVPKQLVAHGLKPEQIEIPDEVLERVISRYTRESGVRDLQRKIGSLMRLATEKVVRQEAGTEKTIRIELSWLDDALGGERSIPEEVPAEGLPPGVVTGLAWTPTGGEILYVEVRQMPGKGQLTLTGQLGDVMKESAQIAMSLVRSKLPFWTPALPFETRDVHIHVPAGAIPKDGPSAGITMFTALASLFSGKAVNPRMAMTGELTLRGSVMPVGGIKEKVIAAHRAGVKTVLLPKRNERDLRDVPQEVKDSMKFEFVENVSQVLSLALDLDSESSFDLDGIPPRPPAVA